MNPLNEIIQSASFNWTQAMVNGVFTTVGLAFIGWAAWVSRAIRKKEVGQATMSEQIKGISNGINSLSGDLKDTRQELRSDISEVRQMLLHKKSNEGVSA